MIFREETLQNVISAVTGNLRSIIFTFILALILVYFFSIFGFIFFQGNKRAIDQDNETLKSLTFRRLPHRNASSYFLKTIIFFFRLLFCYCCG